MKDHVRWLQSALRIAPKTDEQETLKVWERFTQRFGQNLSKTYQDVVRSRLDMVQRLVRPRLSNYSWTRLGTDYFKLEGAWEPDGSVEHRDVTLIIHSSTEDGIRPAANALRTVIQHGAYGPNMKEEIVVFHGFVDPDVRTVRLHARIISEAGLDDTCTWEIKAPISRSNSRASQVDLDSELPILKAALLKIVLSWTSGVGVISCDTPVEPEILVHELEKQGGTEVVAVDAILRDHGPGRKYGETLVAGNLLRALSGRAPALEPWEQEEEADAFQRCRDGVERLVLFPARETVQRLLESDLADIFRASCKAMTRHAQGQIAPAVLWFLPGELAGRVAGLIGQDARFLVTSRLHCSGASSSAPVEHCADQAESTEWLKSRAQLSTEDARSWLRQSGFDLRIASACFEAGFERGSETQPELVLEVARKDLRALDAEATIGLMLLAGGCTEIPSRKAEMGMILACSPLTKGIAGPGSKADSIGPGTVLTASNLARIWSQTKAKTKLLVQGYMEGGIFTPGQDFQHLMSLLPDSKILFTSLLQGGFAEIVAGTVRVHPLYSLAVGHAFSSGVGISRAFRLLTGRTTLLEGLLLERLQDIDEDGVLYIDEARPSTERVQALRAIGRLWSKTTEEAGPPSKSLCAAVARYLSGRTLRFFRRGAEEPAPEGDPGSAPLRLLALLGDEQTTLVGLDAIGTKGLHRYFLAITTNTNEPPIERIRELLEAFADEEFKETGKKVPHPLLICLGPGTHAWRQPSRDSGQVVLRERDLRAILAAKSSTEAFWATLRAHTGLERISPFHHIGALPLGSPMFVGRSRIIKVVRANLLKRNFLILGSRQIGKTSLLFQIIGIAKEDPSIVPLYIDLFPIYRCEQLGPAVRRLQKERGCEKGGYGDPIDWLADLCRTIKARGLQPMLFFNETDNIINNDTRFIETIRSLWDQERVFFVATGYPHVNRLLQSTDHALYHMVSGFPDEKAFNLGVLERDEALRLIDKLEEEPLQLDWRSEQDRRQGRELTLRYTHGVPWVIQDFCARLVRRLDRDRRSVLVVEDVERLAGDVHPLLGFLDGLDFARLLRGVPPALTQSVARLILTTIARTLYFDGERLVDRADLPARSPASISFTASDVADMLRRSFRRETSAMEASRLEDFFRTVNLEIFLQDVCFTLILAPLKTAGEPSYCFQNHIYPLELRRAERQGRRVEDRHSELLLAVLEGLPEAAVTVHESPEGDES